MLVILDKSLANAYLLSDDLVLLVASYYPGNKIMYFAFFFFFYILKAHYVLNKRPLLATNYKGVA